MFGRALIGLLIWEGINWAAYLRGQKLGLLIWEGINWAAYLVRHKLGWIIGKAKTKTNNILVCAPMRKPLSSFIFFIRVGGVVELRLYQENVDES